MVLDDRKFLACIVLEDYNRRFFSDEEQLRQMGIFKSRKHEVFT